MKVQSEAMTRPLSANAFEEIVARIQALPPEVRWLSADQGVLLAMISGVSGRGPRQLLVDRLVSYAMICRVARPLVAMGTIVLSFAIFVKQYATKVVPKPSSALFVGIGALRETPLVEEFERICGRPALRLDETDIETFFATRRVGLIAMARQWFEVWREVWADLSPANPRSYLQRSYRFSYMLLVGYRFIYWRAWFKDYLDEAGRDVLIGFSAASYAAFAAIAKGAKAIYLQHGFQRRSIVLPDFSAVYCFNRFDADHCLARLPRATVTIRAENTTFIESRRLIAIGGIYGRISEFDLCRSLIEWARSCEVPIVIRPHPRDTSDYWKQWIGVSGIELFEEQCDFDTFLEKIRPRFLATWFSTALFDALRRGVVPVTLSGELVESGDVVFPFHEVAVGWPEDRMTVQRMLDDQESRAKFIERKYLEATGQLVRQGVG